MNSDQLILAPADLGAAVRRARKAYGLTQTDLAVAAGTSVPFVVDLERGKATIQLGLTIGVLRALGLQLTVAGAPEGNA